MPTSADLTASEAPSPTYDQGVLREIARRVLWLSAAIVDAANAGRPNHSGVRVGGHQASSASMVDIMTALWFAELTPLDRVSVKPARLPGAACHQLPAGRPRRVLPADLASQGRPAVLPLPD